METYLVWILIGFGLVIVELLSGTFYLLMLGVAAFGAAAAAFFGLSFPIQAITATVTGVAGSWFVHLYRIKNSQQQMKSMDYAQPVVFEVWVDKQARRAKVMYRGAPWEAQVDNDNDINAGATLYIIAANGNTLMVSQTRPV